MFIKFLKINQYRLSYIQYKLYRFQRKIISIMSENHQESIQHSILQQDLQLSDSKRQDSRNIKEEEINQAKYQEQSYHQQFQSSHYSSEQQQVDENRQNGDNSELNRDIIVFPKNITKIQKFQNSQKDSQNKRISQEKILTYYPWLNEKTRAIQNPLLKLHNQIIDFFIMFQEEQETHLHLLSAFNKFQGIIFKTFKNCQVLAPFLSNRAYLKNSEIQIFVIFDKQCWRQPQTIQKVKQCIEKCSFEHLKFFQVNPTDNSGKQSKVGFNCITKQKKYPVQIKIVSQEWISYLSMINDGLQNQLQSKYLFLVFDTIIRQRGLQNSVKSYLTFGLILVFLHERKKQKSRSLTQNLLKFLEYFGIGPFTQRKITYLGRGEFQIKQEGYQDPYRNNSYGHNSYGNNSYGNNAYGNNNQQFSFWINEGIDISNHMIREFFSILRNRYRLISNFNFCHSQSILASLINPIEDQFRY